MSIVVLTLNEEANIEACLLAVAAQRVRGFELLVIDAGSTDATVARIQALAPHLPYPLHLHVGPHRMPIGEARNLGVAKAQADRVGFLSADAELAPQWMRAALAGLRRADMAFGPQRHAPHQWTVGAAVRGLRYCFPEGRTRNPLRYASNVAAAYRKNVLTTFPFDPWANAAEDTLLAQRAHAAGYRATYEPDMLVHHHDVHSWRQEWRKNWREGDGCGRYAAELGIQWPVLAWAALLAAGAAASWWLGPPGLVLLAGVVWLPALRRAARRRRAMPALPLWAGVAASPLFDAAFLVRYARGLVAAVLPRRAAGSK